jgi:LysR family glycine cleavage system transcriptional activator
MNDLPLVALRAFAVVYQTGGIRAAASKLGIAHSSVSRHVRELETRLGTALTVQDSPRKGLGFTREGEVLGAATLASLGELYSAFASVREGRSTGTVTISTIAAVAERLLLPALRDFHASHPEVELSIVVEQRLVSFEDRDIDLAVRMGRGRWTGVEIEPLMDDQLFPVMSPDLFATMQPPVTLETLAGCRLLHDRDPQASWESWRTAFGPARLDVQHGPRFTSSELLIRAAILGHGVALAHGRLVQGDIAAGRLVRPFGDLAVNLGATYWLVRPSHARLRPAVDTVVKWLKSLEAGNGREKEVR